MLFDDGCCCCCCCCCCSGIDDDEFDHIDAAVPFVLGEGVLDGDFVVLLLVSWLLVELLFKTTSDANLPFTRLLDEGSCWSNPGEDVDAFCSEAKAEDDDVAEMLFATAAVDIVNSSCKFFSYSVCFPCCISSFVKLAASSPGKLCS